MLGLRLRLGLEPGLGVVLGFVSWLGLGLELRLGSRLGPLLAVRVGALARVPLRYRLGAGLCLRLGVELRGWVRTGA